MINTAFSFRNPNPNTADLVSQALSSQKIEGVRKNYSYGANTICNNISIGTQRLIQQIVTSSKNMDLNKMKCYLRLASNYQISLMNLTLIG